MGRGIAFCEPGEGAASGKLNGCGCDAEVVAVCREVSGEERDIVTLTGTVRGEDQKWRTRG